MADKMLLPEFVSKIKFEKEEKDLAEETQRKVE